MEWDSFQVLITVVGFVGGFIAGTWKLSAMITRLDEKVERIDKCVNSMLKDRLTLQDHEYRIKLIEVELGEFKETAEKLSIALSERRCKYDTESQREDGN